MDFRKEFGEIIKETREKIGWTQSQLGSKCGVNKTQISKIENDVTCASMKVFISICETLGIQMRAEETKQKNNNLQQVFIIPSATSNKPFQISLLKNLKIKLDREGYSPSERILSTDYSISDQIKELQKILDTKRDYLGGIVVPATSERMGDHIRRFLNSFKKPVVFIDQIPFEDEILYPKNAAFVGFNNKIGGKLAAEAVVQELNKMKKINPSILVIGGRRQVQRQDSFVEFIRILLPEISLLTVNIQAEFRRDKAEQIANHYFKEARNSINSYDVVFCTSDEMALGVLNAISWAYKRCNETPIVIGYDAIEEAVTAIKNGTPLKNSVVQSTDFLAEKAVEILIQMLKRETFHTVNFLEPELYN